MFHIRELRNQLSEKFIKISNDLYYWVIGYSTHK